MPLIKAGDINLEYYDEGEGPPLLMIRGLGAQCTTWGERLFSELRPHFRLIRFSNRGTGLSDKPPGPFTIRTMADDTANLLSALGIERTHVFSVSMGGMIAQELALAYPDRVDRLVLACTFTGGPHAVRAGDNITQLLMPEPGLSPEDRFRRSWPAMTTQEMIGERRDFLEEMLAIDMATPTPMETIAGQMEAIGKFDTYDRLPEIKCPTLVLHGDSDVLVPTENARIIHERIPGSTLEIIPGAAHMFFWEQPERTAAILKSFLLKVPAGQD